MLTQFAGLTNSLLSKNTLNEVLEEVLDASIELLDSDFGTVQIRDQSSGILSIFAQRGFDRDFLDFFAKVHDESGASGLAIKRRQRVVIEDVELDPDYEEYREIARHAGYRAMQSTPMFARDGRVLGMISNHFAHPHRPDDFSLRILDLYARQAADLIEREQQRTALQEAVVQLEQTSEELRQANDIKNEFMGLVSHELRTPLAIILGDARLLKNRRRSLASDDVDTLLSDVADEALRLNDMISHLIGLAKSDLTEIEPGLYS